MLRLIPMHAVAAGLLAFSGMGCGWTINLEDDCRWTLTCSCTPDRPGPDRNTMVADDCGIFASSSLGNDANPGSKAQPVATLTKALELASRPERPPLRIYACGETFPEAITVPAGMTVYGGLDCNDRWVRGPLSKNTKLEGSPGQIPLVVQSDTEIEKEGPDETRIERLDMFAADAQARGGSSIAVLVQPQIVAVFKWCNITAGNGADGVDGDSADPQNAPAKSGTLGNNGGNACTADDVLGGMQAQTECGEWDSSGGKGGNGAPAMGSAGANGQPEPSPSPSNAGLGGSGEDSVVACSAGMAGDDGAHGEHGQGAHGAAEIGLSGYKGSWGSDGIPGMPGQGGGGGGGSKAGPLICGAGPSGGASGGSGGGGGCGGRFGLGGGPGGASIGVIDLSGHLSLIGPGFIHTGKGGRGGAGGLHQYGGSGGVGGVGGLGVMNASSHGCPGGPGGKGGNGGHGGGGRGGASIAIAHTDAPPMNGLETPSGTPGRGGGNPAIPVTVASDGETSDKVRLLRAD